MKKIFFEHVNTYYIDELCDLIQKKIDEYGDDYDLFNISYSGLEKNEGNAHAYLIFKLIKEQI